ncbi:hypothetical protein KL920_001077 [Ogataea angusta]|nr:hypothetical protein KL920_001077 [Ogataea angusta]
MPFKLEALFTQAIIWTRCVYALSTISDTIKVTLKEAGDKYELLLTAVNINKTSSLTCTFRQEFFHTFTIEGDLPVVNNTQTFSFLINSKTMNVCFKDCENTESLKMLLIHENVPDSSQIFSNKLFVEAMRTNGVTKNYSLTFRPGYTSDDLKISRVYARLVRTQDQEDRVHHLVMDIRILKKFLSMFGQGLEDFRLEVYPSARKMLLHGFNRKELLSQKNASLATQPMSLSMQLSLNDLVDENTLPGDEKHTIAFRLRDFRTFVQLAGAESGECSIKFSYEGSPIVFERRIARGEHDRCEVCLFTLTMISDSEAAESAPFAEPAKQPQSAESLFVSEPAESTAPAQIVWDSENRDTATQDRPRSPPATARAQENPQPEPLPFDPDQLDPTQVPIAKGLFD